ncbi:MAG: hypothetical protein ACJATO_002762, partial [Arenicella sp.]
MAITNSVNKNERCSLAILICFSKSTNLEQHKIGKPPRL